ncbi:MAG: osmoprotectant transport system substrate-binding protein opuBD [Blastocatellia bacterium]|jgi:osmoprotectant transport system permease protein|nr:osmoprotectant transport system substrate-binding protein opuBD [Blastocatellia bacterium]
MNFLRSNWQDLLAHVAQHLWLVFIATGVAAAIGVPLGIYITRHRRLRGPVLGIANVMQTIPSLALFGFLIPLPFIGGIGPRTAIVALVFYALLPIIRNTVTGILGVDKTVREAAVAMGMTDRQVLLQVELPLAMNVLLTGVRVAVVITVGVAVIAATVGAGGLGEYIFRGLRSDDSTLLLAGAIPSALMALAADFGFGLIEKRFDITRRKSVRRNKATGVIVVLAFAGLIALGVVGGSLIWQRSGPRPQQGPSHGHLAVGSKDFTESILLAEIVAQMLEAQNIQVDRHFDLGGNLAHSSLVAGQIDLYPEYTGTSYTAILHHQPISDARAVYEQVKSEYAEKFNVWVSDPLGFENTFAILVRGEDARRLNLKTISEAAKYAPQWRAGFGQDFMSRADGYPGFSKAYGLRFAQAPREMALDLTYTALAARKVDLIAGNSTDGRIAALDLVQLEDDRHYFPPYEAVLLISRTASEKVTGYESPGTKAVHPLSLVVSRLAGAITTEEMRKLNYEVDGNKRDKKDVVREWLKAKGL